MALTNTQQRAMKQHMLDHIGINGTPDHTCDLCHYEAELVRDNHDYVESLNNPTDPKIDPEVKF